MYLIFMQAPRYITITNIINQPTEVHYLYTMSPFFDWHCFLKFKLLYFSKDNLFWKYSSHMLQDDTFQIELILQPHTCSELCPWKYALIWVYQGIDFNYSRLKDIDDCWGHEHLNVFTCIKTSLHFQQLIASKWKTETRAMQKSQNWSILVHVDNVKPLQLETGTKLPSINRKFPVFQEYFLSGCV